MKLKVIFLIAFLFRFSLAFLTWHPDVRNHMDWGSRFWDYGPAKFYEANVWNYTWPNQPPGTIYLFAGVYQLYKAIFSFFWWVNVTVPIFPSNVITYFESNLYPALLKLPAILCDLGIAFIFFRIFKEAKKEKIGVIAATIFLFNPAIWYNSSIWGQTDSIVNFFVLASFYFLLKKEVGPAIFFLATSFYIKLSLLYFVPIFLVLMLRQKLQPDKIIKTLFLTSTFFLVLTLPFSHGEPVGWLFNLYKDKVLGQQLHVITANAFNLWAGLTGIHQQPYTKLLGPLTYQTWGTILYLSSYIPAIYVAYKKQPPNSIFWVLSIVSLSSFMVLTNMHERYLYPFLTFFVVVAVLDVKLLYYYWVISFINLLNLYNFWWMPKIDFIIVLMSAGDRLMPKILGAVSFLLFLLLYSEFLKKFILRSPQKGHE